MHRFVIAPNEQVRETPFIEHNIAATRKAFALDRRRGARAVGRCAAHARRHRRERRDARQRPALGSPAAAADVRADPGDPHVLRLRLGPQRSLHDRRRVPADHAVGARAELRQPAEPQLDQRAADVHARLRRDAGAGQPGHAGRPAGAVHQGPAAAVVGGSHRSTSRASTTGSSRTTTCSSRPTRASFTTRRARTTSTRPTKARGGVPVSNFFRRLLFSIRFRSFKVLLSDDITNESRVMFHRRLSERVARIAPFLQYDPDPYLVISNGRLFWVQDGYTVSRPLSVFHAGGRTASTTSGTR